MNFLAVIFEVSRKKMCNMRGRLVGVSVPPGTPQLASPKEINHTEISISYKAVWPIRSGYLLALITYVTPLSLSALAIWLGTFFSCQLTCCFSGGLHRSGEGAFSSLALSYSHCPASTSCLVDPPILPAWPISVLLKYMIDRIQTILPHHFPLFFLNKGKYP